MWENFDARGVALEAIGYDTPQPSEDPEDPEDPVQAAATVETIRDAQALSAEITDLAVALGRDPVRIFNYVRNTIDYEHYFGLRKGAELTLLEGSGNDFDQCELLAQLLTAAGHTTTNTACVGSA